MRPYGHIERVFYWMCFFMLFLSACSSSKSEEPSGPLEDFGLSHDTVASRATSDQYYSDLERSTAAIPFRSSFPLAFTIAGTRSKFEAVPAEAHSPLPSR